MPSKDLTQNSTNDGQPSWLRSEKRSMVFRLILGVGLPTAFGVYFFCQGLQSEAEYQQKMESIRRDNVKPAMLRVTKIVKGEDWIVSLGKNGATVATRSASHTDGLGVGDRVEAYPFEKAYLIPRFDGVTSSGKWQFLIFGMGIGVLFGTLTAFKLRRLNRWTEKAESPSSSSERQATDASPKAFSRPSMSFDHRPSDAELTALLGKDDHGLVSWSEEGGMLIARPWVLPMKWILLGLAIITFLGLVCWVPVILNLGHGGKMNSTDLHTFCFYWFLVWLAAMVGMLLTAVSVRRTLIKNINKREFFKIDMLRRTLELCSAGRTFKAGEIVGFTVLSRRCRSGSDNDWKGTRQTGVLVRTPNGLVEHFALLHEWAETGLTAEKSKWADRLAGIFCVPVRRISLNLKESRELKDC